MSTPRHEETRPVHVAKQNTERAESTTTKEQIHMNSTPDATHPVRQGNPPAGFEMIPDIQFHPDGTWTMSAPGSVYTAPRDLGDGLSDEIAVEPYWRPGDGHFYSITTLFEEYTLDDLRKIRDHLDEFLHRAAQLEGGAR